MNTGYAVEEPKERATGMSPARLANLVKRAGPDKAVKVIPGKCGNR